MAQQLPSQQLPSPFVGTVWECTMFQKWDPRPLKAGVEEYNRVLLHNVGKAFRWNWSLNKRWAFAQRGGEAACEIVNPRTMPPGKVFSDDATWESFQGWICHLGKFSRMMPPGKVFSDDATWESFLGRCHLGKFSRMNFATGESFQWICGRCHLGKFLMPPGKVSTDA